MLPRVKTRAPFVVIAVAAFVILSVRIVYPRVGPPLIVNYTASEPRGVYWIERHASSDYRRGQTVVFPLPQNVHTMVYGRRWLNVGEPLIKGIGALEGDHVCIDDAQAHINEHLVGRVFPVDSLGRPMPAVRGCFTIAAGYFFPLSTLIEHSFDGRYIGPQPLNAILGELHPLWTF